MMQTSTMQDNDAGLTPAAADAPVSDRDRADAQSAMRQRVQGMLLDWLRAAWDARYQSGIEQEWQLAEDLYAGVEPVMGDKQAQHGATSA